MSLYDLAVKYGTDKGEKHGYCDIYEKYFEPYRYAQINLLELGIDQGASLRMWNEYFTKGYILGIDKKLPEPIDNIYMRRGEQGDPKVYGKRVYDIVIDDCSHEDDLTIYSLLKMIDRTKIYYCIEDLNCKRFKNINKFLDFLPGIVFRDKKLVIIRGLYGS